MDVSALALGLLLAFVGVIWWAMVMWNMICPPDVFAREKRKVPVRPAPLSAVPPVVHCDGDARYPVVSLPDILTAASMMPPEDEKIVSLSEWRARDERIG